MSMGMIPLTEDSAEGNEMKDTQPRVASVERALDIIGAFRPTDSSLTLHDLAARTGLYKSTILRLIATLSDRHCIVRLDDGSYQLGPMLLHWGGLYQAALRLDDHVLPVLRQLTQETGEGSSFFTRRENMRLCLFRVDSPKMLRDHVHVGDLLPLDKGAAGRVLTVFDPAITPPEDAPSSPVLATVGEREPDIAALAAPVFGTRGTLSGAIAISGPIARFSDEVRPGLSDALVAAAIKLTQKLGGSPGILLQSSKADDFASIRSRL